MSKIKFKNNTFCLRSVRAPTTKEQRARSRYTCVHSETQTHRGAHETERWRGGGVIPAHPGDIKVEITHTHALFVLKLRARVCVCARALAAYLHNQRLLFSADGNDPEQNGKVAGLPAQSREPRFPPPPRSSTASSSSRRHG